MRYGINRPIAGEYGGQLSNGGETLRLVDAAGSNVLALTYGTTAPWPAAPDGSGPSLEVIVADGDLSSPANWQTSGLAGGSPGLPNPIAAPSLEVLPGTEGYFRFLFRARAGVSYGLLSRAEAQSGAWAVVQEWPARQTNGPVIVELPLPADGRSRFFRLETK
jgi:hypothetical protein